MISQLPAEHLSYAGKIREYGSIKEYCLEMARAIRRSSMMAGSHNRDRFELQNLYLLSKGDWNPEDADMDMIEKPYGEGSYTFPTAIDHKDRVSPILNLLRGESIKRPFNYRVVDKSFDGTSEFEMKELETVQQYAAELFTHQMGAREKPAPGLSQRVDQVRKRYISAKEKMGNDAIRYLRHACHLDEVFAQGFKNHMWAASEVYWTGITAGEPDITAIDPRYFDCERFPGQRTVQEAGWWIRWRYIPVRQVYEEYHKDLKPDDLQALDEIKGGLHAGRIGSFGGGRPPIIYQDDNSVSGNGFIGAGSSTLVCVTDCYWVGRKQIQYIYFDDEDGIAQMRIEDEDYKPGKGERAEQDWINQLWETTIIADDICTRYQPHPVTAASLDNPNKVLSPFVGVLSDYNLVKVLKPLQYLYNRVFSRLEMMLARAKGKGFVMDIAQLPASMGFDVEKWLYYLDTMGVAFINSFEEQKKGQAQGRFATFNQFQTFDMTLSSGIGEMINILAKIEEHIGHISGVTEQRLGQIQTSELVGNVKRSVVQSSHITEPLFFLHDIARRMAIENLLEYAKEAWKHGKKTQFILSDGARALLDIDEGFAEAEIGLFVSNASEDAEIMEAIKAMLQPAIQAGSISISTIVKLLKSDSIASAEKMIEEMEQQMQEQGKAQQEAEQQALQAQQETEDHRLEYQEENKYRIADERNKTDLRIAFMGDESKAAQEQEKIKQQSKQVELQHQENKAKLSLEERKHQDEVKLKEKEIAVKKIAARKKPAAGKK